MSECSSRKMGRLRGGLCWPVQAAIPISTWHSMPCSRTTAARSVCRAFYDGDGIYRIRFMPDNRGRMVLQDAFKDPGSSTARPARLPPADPSEGNHGPVRVRNKFHFGYADGNALPFIRNDLLCLDAPAARDAERRH